MGSRSSRHARLAANTRRSGQAIAQCTLRTSEGMLLVSAHSSCTVSSTWTLCQHRTLHTAHCTLHTAHCTPRSQQGGTLRPLSSAPVPWQEHDPRQDRALYRVRVGR
eukprot:2690744-Rhodomonas_salina.1